jgi:hypothetical protein
MSSSTPANPLPIQPSTAIQLAAQQGDQIARGSDDVILEILCRTSIPAIGACRAVCMRLNVILKPDNNWQRIFFSLFPNLKLNPINNFRLACKKQHFLNSNRDKGVFATHIINGGRNPICEHIAIGNENLYAAHSGGLIKIFDVNSLEWKASLDPEQSVQVFPWNGKLVGKLRDNTIKVWDLQSLTSLVTLPERDPGKTTLSMITDAGELVCISPDGDLRITNLNIYQCSGPFVLNINSEIVSHASHGRKLYLGTRDGQIIIFDLEKQKQTGQLDAHGELVSAMAASNGKLYSIAIEELKIWDLESNTCESSWNLGDPSDAGRCTITAMKIVGDTLVYALSGDVIIWDIASKKMKLRIKGDGFVFKKLEFIDNSKILGSGSFNKEIKVYDFATEDEPVLRAIIRGFKRSDYFAKEYQADALQRFSRMPPYIKEKVYEHLYEMMNFSNHGEYYEGIVEDVFFDQYGQVSSFSLKARAIECYLNSEKSRPLPKKPLLASLGIVSKEQYSEKLKCRPEYLRQIGLLSSQDLLTICSFSPQIQVLPIEEAANETNFRDNGVKVKADNRRIALFDLADQMSQKVNKNIAETKQCGVLLYDGDMPWIGFETKLNAFQSKLQKILDECDGSPALLVKAFQSSEYNLLAEELNSLVEEFKKLDNEHQVAKLSTYINQFGILKAWEGLHEKQIYKLSNLLGEAKGLDRILQMGV